MTERPAAGRPAPEDDATLFQTQRTREGGAQRSLMQPLAIGGLKTITGYTLLDAIGQGAFAEVWKAKQERTGKLVAIKFFTSRGEVDWASLEREIARLITLDKHPHIVSLLDADLKGEPPWIAMELLEAGSLKDRVKAGEPVAPAQAAQWMEEIASALAFVHAKGILHCDLKPGNVLLDERGTVRVVDFGQ
ncbi:MAG: serine/threonine-protein kinase, partial [bacterium]